MSAELWLQIFEKLNPKKIVLTTPFHFQAGIIMGVLRYNDKRFGLPATTLVLFHPGAEEDGVSKGNALKRKRQTAHIADHTLERVCIAYQKIRSATVSIGKRALLRKASNAPEAISPKGKDPAAELGTEDSVKVVKVITLIGNVGKGKVLLTRPVREVPQPDSDDDDGNSSSRVHEQSILSKRNSSVMAKYNVKVQASTPASGYGLFASAPLLANFEIPMKGPWFRSSSEVQKYLADVHPVTAAAWSKRVVRVQVSPLQDAKEDEFLYKVITDITGFVNSPAGIMQRSNAQIVFDSDRGLGDHALRLKLIKPVSEGQQITVAYGPFHAVGVTRKRGSSSAGGD